MNKRRRHATRISESSALSTRLKAHLARGYEQANILASTRLARVTMIPALLIGAAACSLVLGISGSESEQIAEKAQPSSQSITIPLPLTQDPEPQTEDRAVAVDGDRYQLDLDLQASLSQQTETVASAAPPQWREERASVKSGDTLSELFQQVGLGANTVYRITNSSKAGKDLTRMYPGEELVFEFGPENELHAITRIKSQLEQIKFSVDGEGFRHETISFEPEIRQVNRSAAVNSSLSQAAFKAGLSSSITMNMANIFGGVMDFALDVRPGDQFTIIYEELYLNGEKIDDGNIVAAQYVNSGKIFNAFRYIDNNGDVGYFNEDGESMRKVFLRAPLDFTRVSSGFNLKRLHPITKKVKPHRGIDYSAPTGTPIFSVGDGRVSASGYSKANGNYVFIRHGESYVTKYLHLKKRSVKSGQRVKQGQIIGSVGCTGLCTGPHLHYEFLVNGVHRNPRTIVSKLPKAKRLAKSELSQFAQTTRGQQDLLQHYGYKTTIALSN